MSRLLEATGRVIAHSTLFFFHPRSCNSSSVYLVTGIGVLSHVQDVGNVPLLIVATTVIACCHMYVAVYKALVDRQSSLCISSTALLHCRVDVPCAEECCYAVITYADALPVSADMLAGSASLIELCFCSLDCDNDVSSKARYLPLQ